MLQKYDSFIEDKVMIYDLWVKLRGVTCHNIL